MSMTVLVACLTFCIWLYLLLARGGFWKITMLDSSPIRGEKMPEIAVVIPARNEAAILSDTLHTLLSTDYPGTLHIILVDDRSEDATAATAMQIAKTHDAADRLTVISGHARPGWKGKVAAMQCGLDHAGAHYSPRYILFTDADIAYDKGAITRLVVHAEASQCVLTSLMVKLRCKSMAERWLIPAFVYFFEMLYPFAQVNDPSHKTAAAAGGCMLMRHDALQKAGGLESIRTALIDDCAMGRMMKRQGSVSLHLTNDVHSLRPYPALSDIRAMVARSAYDQLDYSVLNLTVTVLGLLVTYIAPVLLTLFARGWLRVAGMASWAIMAITFFPILRFYRLSAFFALALPGIALFYLSFTLDSAIQFWRGKGGLWKGRVQASGTNT